MLLYYKCRNRTPNVMGWPGRGTGARPHFLGFQSGRTKG